MSSDGRIRMLWIEMGAVFGAQWISAMSGETGPVAMAMWGQHLGDLPDEMIDRGVEACATEARDWPPSLAQFRQLCLGLGDDGAALAAAMRGDKSNAIAAQLIPMVSSWDRDRMTAKDLERRYRDGLAEARQAAEAAVIPPERRLT